MARKPYNVVFTYSVQVWAEDEDEAGDEARLFARDEAGLGSEAFDQLDFGVMVEEIDPDQVYPRLFINEEAPQ